MERVARLMALSYDSPDQNTMKRIYEGQVVAFGILQQIGDAYSHQSIYRAVQTVQSMASDYVLETNDNTPYNPQDFNKQTGALILDIIDEDDCFESIDDLESEFLWSSFTNQIDSSTLECNDFTSVLRGYRLVRLAETWHRHQTHLEAVEKQRVQTKIENYNNQNKLDVATQNALNKTDEEIDLEFTRLVQCNELNDLHTETLQPCNQDIDILVDKLTQHISELDYPDIYDPSVVLEIQAKLAELITDDFSQLESLKFQDDITVTGDMAATVYNSEDNTNYTFPIRKSSTVRGSICNVHVMPTPTQAWVDRALQEPGTEVLKSDLNPYGLVFEVDLHEITNPNNTLTKTLPCETFYLPLDYSNTEIARDPYSKARYSN